MTNNILYTIYAFIVGVLLGTIFFGGLWFTIKQSVTSTMPGLLFVASFVLRIAITLFGFYYVAQGNWVRLIACLIGFTVARFSIIFLTKNIDKKAAQKKEVGNEIKS